MAQYPLEYNGRDSESVIEAINYVLSGPQGLGQNFSGFSDSYTAWLKGNIRTPSTVAGYTTSAHGASGSTDITVSNPGSVRQNDPNVPSKIVAGQYVYGTNIGTNAQVDISYDPTNTPWLVPLTVANTGAVQGGISFYNQSPPALYVAPITIGTINWIDLRTIQVNFATSQPSPPFELASLPTVSGSTAYNGTYIGPGVVECTESYVILQRSFDQVDLGTATGGTITVSNTQQPPTVGTDPGFPSAVYFNATDCSATAVVGGSLDRVFIAAQIDNTITYTASASSDIEYTVAVNRYIGSVPTLLTQGSIQYYYDTTVASQSYNYSVTPGTATLPIERTQFVSIIDKPTSNLYLYRLDLLFKVINDSGSAEITVSKLGNRSISVQVVKE